MDALIERVLGQIKNSLCKLVIIEPDVLVMLYDIRNDLPVLIIFVDFKARLSRDAQVSSKSCTSTYEWDVFALE